MAPYDPRMLEQERQMNMQYQQPQMQDPMQQQQMQDALRQRMQRYGGVTPMNFNPEAQGVRGFAPTGMQPQMQSMNYGNQMQNTMMNNQQSMAASDATMSELERNAMANRGPEMAPPEQMAPQMPQHMQMQQARMNQMRQGMNANRNMMRQQNPQGMAATPDMAAYKANKTQPDFMGMRNAASAARGAMTPGKPMGRVAAGLGAAGSAMGLANQARNQAKKQQAVSGRSNTAAKAKTAGGQLQQAPTF